MKFEYKNQESAICDQLGSININICFETVFGFLIMLLCRPSSMLLRI